MASTTIGVTVEGREGPSKRYKERRTKKEEYGMQV
jgi:hypothetical protein